MARTVVVKAAQANFPLSERWSVIGGYEMTYI